MHKRCLYIVLTRTNTIISRLIGIFTKDEYTHAAIALDKELDNMYSFGRKYIHNPFVGSFKVETVDNGVYKFHKEVPSIVLEVEVSKQQYEKAQSLISQFISNSRRYKYNYRGLLHSLSNTEACEADRFLCSEFVYHVLKESGIADFQISRNLVRPQNLLALEGTVVFKGDLKQFRKKENCGITKENYGPTGEGFMRRVSAAYE